jgi:hypothetical protein
VIIKPIATARSTESLSLNCAAAAAGPGEADGLVLTSSVGVATRHGGNGKECGAKSHHGYLGIERKVVDTISAWIKSH